MRVLELDPHSYDARPPLMVLIHYNRQCLDALVGPNGIVDMLPNSGAEILSQAGTCTDDQGCWRGHVRNSGTVLAQDFSSLEVTRACMLKCHQCTQDACDMSGIVWLASRQSCRRLVQPSTCACPTTGNCGGGIQEVSWQGTAFCAAHG